MAPVIEVENLEFSYGSHRVLANVSCRIEEGEFVALLGPNGSGKTTLFNIISGILPYTQGSVHVFSRNLKHFSARERARTIGIVPQEITSNFNFGNLEVVLMGRHPRSSHLVNESPHDHAKALEAMKLTHTDHLADRGFMEISGGEKQRVMIAQVLCQETDILLLDEPTSNLDINFQLDIMQLISKLRKERKLTVFGIFHDINLALQYSDRIMLLKEGSVFKDDVPEKIINSALIEEVFQAHVAVERNPFTNKLFVVPKNPDNRNFTGGEGAAKRVHVIAGGGSGSYLFNILSLEGHTVTTCILSSIDTDARVASSLNIPMIQGEPFVEILKEKRDQNRACMMEADIIVVSRVLFGMGNMENLLALDEALAKNKPVYFIDGDNFHARDFTEGKVTEIYNRLIRNGAVAVENEEELAILLK
ncbi:MAG: ATP-binding cassette domain-containing protein [Spirochaetales bacterium]|nr:MAG: ATP-binding cassette domain-containing protein [Spirochaetales bacterium]